MFFNFAELVPHLEKEKTEGGEDLDACFHPVQLWSSAHGLLVVVYNYHFDSL